MWYNTHNEHFWIKCHFRTEQGARGLSREDVRKLKGQDPDHATRDLHEAIARKNYPAWTVYVQIMTPEQARAFLHDPFDPTKVWPHGASPLRPLGSLVLDTLPESYFQDVEQAAFNPSSFVPGIAPSPDKMLQGSPFSCHEAQIHRLRSLVMFWKMNKTFARCLAHEVDIDPEDVTAMAGLSFAELLKVISRTSPGTEAAKRTQAQGSLSPLLQARLFPAGRIARKNRLAVFRYSFDQFCSCFLPAGKGAALADGGSLLPDPGVPS